MIRRIKTRLKKFFEEKPLTDKEKHFIIGCINAQNQYPQLTMAQWRIIKEIESKYKGRE